LNSVLRTITSRGGALASLVNTLQDLVSGLAADRQPIGTAISAISQLTSATAGLLQVGRAPLAADISQLGRLASNLANNSGTVNTFLQDLPLKMIAITRLASYGSWLNFFLCDATVTGVHSPFGRPPEGVPLTAARCQS
jgi:phospholipid/cholesterol/gamma-HCH transport system substrate-binding protein